MTVSEGIDAAVRAARAGAAGSGAPWTLHIDAGVRDRRFDEADAVQEVMTLLIEAAMDSTPSGSLQLKAQSVPAGIAIDLISACSDTTEGRQAAVRLQMAGALVSVMNGRLDVKFTPGRGLWFNLVLPAAGLK